MHAINEVRARTSTSPVIVGGLAVLCRLENPYRATTDLDIVERSHGSSPPQLQILRSAEDIRTEGDASVHVPTSRGYVRVDFLTVNQADLDQPSDYVGDRLYATAHAWAHATATELTVQVVRQQDGQRIVDAAAVTSFAEPGPLVAMKLQAADYRGSAKQGTDLYDIVRLIQDPAAGKQALDQIERVATEVAADMGTFTDRWFRDELSRTLSRVRAVGGHAVDDDLALVHELLSAACER